MWTWIKIGVLYHQSTYRVIEFYLCLFCSILPIHFWGISSIMFDRYPCGWCISSWWCCSCHTRLHHRGCMRCVMGMAGDGFWAMTMDWRKSHKVNIDDRWLSCLVSKIDFGFIRGWDVDDDTAESRALRLEWQEMALMNRWIHEWASLTTCLTYHSSVLTTGRSGRYEFQIISI